MLKKIIALFICIFLVVGLTGILSACNNGPQLKIVYLGDSIGEALLGPSPVSERENYGYYALVGRRNDYIYINRAVSGHQTSQMLDLIKQSDESGLKTISQLKTADIIHVSILGNDFLQTNLGDTILLSANGDYTKVNSILKKSKENFANIYETLRSYNEDAVIMFQTVYNPVASESSLIGTTVRESLAEMNIFEDDYRDLGYNILSMLNGVIKDYLAEHEGAFYIIDAYEAFDNIYKEDANRGKALIYADWVHPSNEGHAVIADTIQTQLETLGLANASKALKNYKKIKIEQLKRMYDGQINYSAVKSDINKAKSCSDVTKIYFAATRDKIPAYC